MIISKKKLDAYIKLMWDTKEENEALKKQIARLQYENELTERYRNECERLSVQTKELIGKYKRELEIIQELENEYRKYWICLKKNEG